MQHRCPHAAVWFQFGPCRAYLRFSIYHGNFVWSLDPGSRYSAPCTILLLRFCTVTSPRAAGAGPRDRLFLKRHSSAHIYNSFVSSHHSHGVLGRPQVPGPRPGRGCQCIIIVIITLDEATTAFCPHHGGWKRDLATPVFLADPTEFAS